METLNVELTATEGKIEAFKFPDIGTPRTMLPYLCHIKEVIAE